MKLPSFLKQVDNSLVYNDDGELLFYIPDSYFGDVKKNPIAQIIGQYVSVMGIFDWALVTKNGTVSEAKPFKFPTIILCKPNNIEKANGLKLNGLRAKDYKILHFKNGDEVISDINIPQIIDNVETIFSMMVITGSKIPSTVPYDKIHEYFPESMNLNGDSFGLNMQLFGMMVSELCRNPKDLSKPFRLGKMEKMTDYQQVSVKTCPNYISPYVAFTSENTDESLMAAILLSDQKDEDIKYSPLEKIVTG